MRPMYETLLAAASPVDAPSELYEVVIGGATRPLQRGLVPPDNVIRVTQPRDRGTLPEVALALLQLLVRDPEALIVVSATAQAPLAIVAAVAEIVERPHRVVLLRPDARTLAEGMGFVVEGKQLLRMLFEGAPVWTGVLCESVFDDAALERTYQMLPPAAIEPIVRARAAAQPLLPTDGDIRPTRPLPIA